MRKVNTLLISIFVVLFIPQYCLAKRVNTVSSPVINSISPSSAPAGTFSINITGSNFKAVRSVTTISTTGTAVNSSYVVNSSNNITATASLVAGTYYFQVTTNNGTANSPNLVVTIAPPTISSISPTNGVAGTLNVTISGNNFANVQAVRAISKSTGTAVANSYVVNSPNQITASTNLAADAYYVQVSTTSGTANSPVDLVVSSPTPTPTPAPTPAPAGYFSFDDNTKRLIINTQMLQLGIENGAIVYIKDNASNEVLVDSNSSTNFPISPQFPQGDPRGFLGFTSQDSQGNQYYREPSSSSISFNPISQNHATLTYSPLYFGGSPTGGTLTYDLTVDENTGEILVQLTGVETQSGLTPGSIDLPIMNFMGASVILGSGAKYIRGDPEAKDRSSSPGLGLFSPGMAVLEGRGSCIAVWSESERNLTGEHVGLCHQPHYDHIVLHTPQDAQQGDKRKIVSSPWRIGIYKNWVEAARRWRNLFELRTHAKPLWNNNAAWVRNIHAVYGQPIWSFELSKYTQLASIADPAKVLYFLWNGDRIALFGDPTLINSIAIPTPEQITQIKAGGWPLLLYHPWTMYYTQAGANNRLQTLNANGWLQPDYQFQPDYGGTAADWYTYWAGVDAPYDPLPSGAGTNVIHPGYTNFKNYLVRNYQDYCSLYQANGCYFDILGSDEIAKFSLDRNIIEGQDYATGEKNAIAKINQELPNLAVMSEYIPSRLLPLVFYTWEGYSHVTQNVYAKTKINHPLRTALIGSYVWSHEQDPSNITTLDNNASALLGALPILSLMGDYQISDSVALWSKARCDLFCTHELFNDLPTTWKNSGSYTTLAYYRSNTGNMFRFENRGSGNYAYVEEQPSGDVDRLTYPLNTTP